MIEINLECRFTHIFVNNLVIVTLNIDANKFIIDNTDTYTHYIHLKKKTLITL